MLDDNVVNLLGDGEVLDDYDSDCSGNEDMVGEIGVSDDLLLPASPDEQDVVGDAEEQVTATFMEVIGGVVSFEVGVMGQI